MKVRITRQYFDGLRRHREGSVINISDRKYVKISEIPASSKKRVGDYVEFAPSCMEIVDKKTPIVDVPRPKPGLTPTTLPEPFVGTGEVSSGAGDQSPANQEVI